MTKISEENPDTCLELMQTWDHIAAYNPTQQNKDAGFLVVPSSPLEPSSSLDPEGRHPPCM